MDVLANWLWQGCVVAMAAAVMLRLLETARARLRALLCWAGLAAVLVLPLVPAMPAMPAPAVPAAHAAAASAPVVAMPRAWWTSGAVVGALWGLWAAVAAARLVGALGRVRQARGRCEPFPRAVESRLEHWQRLRGTGRPARLCLSNDVADASVLGGVTAVIAVSPRLLDALRPGELDRVVIHEWAHVQRHDDWLHLIQRAAASIAGWHPAVWWLDRRLTLEREIACDEAVVAATGSRKQYAACLATLAGLRPPAVRDLPVPGALSSSALARRIVRILAPPRHVSQAWTITAGSACVVVLALLGAGASGVRLVETVVPANARLDAPPARNRPTPVTPTLHADAPDAAAAAGLTPEVDAGSPRARPDVPARAARLADSPADPQAAAGGARRIAPSLAPPLASAAIEPQVYLGPAAQAEGRTAGPADEPGTAIRAAAVESLEGPAPAVWGVAAGAGIAAAERSKRAGVAAAGFFNRLGRRVADSF